ncbi:hypothetical protein [Xaviernesmea oryzae]|nr:hypothetical protein [Xaviernesmea oryzae]
MRPLDAEAVARLISGASLNAALWVAASDDAAAVLTKAVEVFCAMASGVLVPRN